MYAPTYVNLSKIYLRTNFCGSSLLTLNLLTVTPSTYKYTPKRFHILLDQFFPDLSLSLLSMFSFHLSFLGSYLVYILICFLADFHNSKIVIVRLYSQQVFIPMLFLFYNLLYWFLFSYFSNIYLILQVVDFFIQLLYLISVFSLLFISQFCP